MDIKDVTITTSKEKVGIPLAALNPDFDGDGKIEKDERALFDQLVAADADGTGSLNAREFYTVLNSFVKTQNNLKRYKVLALIGLVLSLLLALSNLGTSAAVAVMSQEQYVKKPDAQDAGQPMMTNSDGAVIAVVKSETKLPLYAAPVVPMSKLKTVESLEVTYTDGDLTQGIVDVKASLKVRDVKVYSTTRVAFELASGGSVKVWDGDVTYFDSTGDSRPLCAADMDCSAFSVDDVEQAEVLLAEADAALEAIGVAVPTRRRLAGACSNFAKIIARKLICTITGLDQFCLGGDGGSSSGAWVTPVGSSTFCTTLNNKVDLTAENLWCDGYNMAANPQECENSFTHYVDDDLGYIFSPCGWRDGACKLMTLESYFSLYILEFCDASCTTGGGDNCVNKFTQCCDYNKNCGDCSSVLQ